MYQFLDESYILLFSYDKPDHQKLAWPAKERTMEEMTFKSYREMVKKLKQTFAEQSHGWAIDFGGDDSVIASRMVKRYETAISNLDQIELLAIELDENNEVE